MSVTNVYHAILRGVNKQHAIEDEEDYIRFLNVLRRLTHPDVDAQGQTFQPRCHVYAYYLMGNHVHLLLYEGSETIGDIMKRIASSYVYHYNHKYDRVGHLFQERFKSQPVNDFSYFTTLLRYIHQNPLKAMLVDSIDEYEWSSWQEYNGTAHQGFCSTQVVLGRIPFADLKALVETPLAEEDANQFQALPRPQQKLHLFAAHKEGIGPHTLSRFAGVPYSIVQRATSDTVRYSSMVCESLPGDEEHETYIDDSEYEKYPEY